MRNRRTLSSQLTESFGTREKLSERKPATLGVTDSGPVEYPNRDNYVYVRLADNEVVPIYNQRVPKIAGLKVWVGYSKERPDVFQVLDVRDVFANPVRSTVAPHADDHTWPGADTVWVRGEQFLPGMVYPSSTGLVVSVFPLAVRGENNEWFVPRYEELNLSPYQPNSGSYWAVIEYNHTGALQVVTGPWVGVKENLTPDYIPVTSGTTLAAVALYGQGKINRSKKKTDIIDLRSAPKLVSGFTAQTAATISFTPTGTIASSTVQGAVEELMVEKANVSHTHSASDVVTGTFTFNRLQTIGANSFLGRVSLSSGTIEMLTPDQAHSVLNTAARNSLKIPGDEASISERFNSGRTFTEFFDVSGTPVGWTVQTGTPFSNFTPSYSVPSVFSFGTMASGSVYYISRSGVPAAFPVFTLLGFGAGGGFIGYRVDDGTDTNYKEVGIYKAASTELQNIRLIERNGGAVSTTNGTITTSLPFSWISLFQVVGTQWSSWTVNSRWQFLNGIPSVQSNAVSGVLTSTWTPSRFGLIARPETTSVFFVDAISY